MRSEHRRSNFNPDATVFRMPFTTQAADNNKETFNCTICGKFLLSTEWLDYVVEAMKYQAFLPHFVSVGGWCWVVGGGVVGYGVVGGGVVYGCLC